MPGSYERINYSIRPAKSIERKLMGESFRRLSVFGSIESYRYIGFGSPYFSDFSLFHKQLGLTNMISIEKDMGNEPRFQFNRPFKCIDICFGQSNEILPTLNWDVRTIVWLDNDGGLDLTVLTDVRFVCASALPGSVLVVSVNAMPYRPDPDRDRVELLKERVGEENLPRGISDNDLAGWGTARIFRRIIDNKIIETLNHRNGGRAEGTKIQYKQLFNFFYADGAKMLTVGGLLYDQGQEPIVARCAFEALPFTRTDEDPYHIEVPNLTYRELRHLDAQLPCDPAEPLDAQGVPNEDLERYRKIYRYFPTFAESEL